MYRFAQLSRPVTPTVALSPRSRLLLSRSRPLITRSCPAWSHFSGRRSAVFSHLAPYYPYHYVGFAIERASRVALGAGASGGRGSETTCLGCDGSAGDYASAVTNRESGVGAADRARLRWRR